MKKFGMLALVLSLGLWGYGCSDPGTGTGVTTPAPPAVETPAETPATPAETPATPAETPATPAETTPEKTPEPSNEPPPKAPDININP